MFFHSVRNCLLISRFLRLLTFPIYMTTVLTHRISFSIEYKETNHPVTIYEINKKALLNETKVERM